jgi:two-component system cell cycle response regulator
VSARAATAVSRRRTSRAVWLLGAGLIASALAMHLVPELWPLAMLPVLAAHPLAGRRGLVAALLGTAAAFAAVAGRDGAPVASLAVGWVAMAAGASLIGARHGKVRRDLERVEGASLRDRLTGLYNYAFFSDALRRETQRVTRYGGQLTLVLFDLDRFKSFNDTHGHEAGNRLLSEVGRIIESTRRSADVAARFGGEEFALLVPGDAAAGVEAAERLRRAVARVVVDVGRGQHDGRTISAGVATYRRGDPPDVLLEAADRALYLSKRRGRNRVSVSGDAPLARAAGE